jgi:hypothetical protein
MKKIILLLSFTGYHGINENDMDSDWKTIITIAFSLVAIGISVYFAVKQNKQLNKQDEILDNQDKKLEEHNGKLKDSIEKIEKVYQNLKTIDTPDFPNNIEMIDKEIFDFCIENKLALEIYTDVGGYAILSNNNLWRTYYNKVSKCITNNVDVYWYFYNDELQIKQRENQFKEYENNANIEKLRKKVSEYKKNVYIFGNCEKKYGGCPLHRGDTCIADADKELECIPIMKLEDSYDSLINTLQELQRITNENVERLRKRGSVEKIKRLTNELPFFAWFAIEKKGDIKTPVKGIISYNVLKGDVTEKGFITENKELLSVLYDIIQYNIENSSN